MKISVIVPIYNSKRTLPALLRSLAEQDFDLDKFELILIDDGSVDLTEEFKSSVVAGNLYKTTWLYSPHVGPGPARNVGIDCANGDIIAFTDADCEPDKDWLSRIIEMVELNPDIIWSGLVYSSDMVIFPWRMAPVGHYGTANLVGSAEIFRQYKFQNDWLGLCGSDTELTNRFENDGGVVKRTEVLRVHHPVKVYNLKKVIARAWSRQNEVRLMRDLGPIAKLQMHKVFRPIFGQHVSPLLILLIISVLGLAFGGLVMLVLYGFGFLVGMVWFIIYGYKFVLIQTGQNGISFSYKVLTLVYLIIYLPVMIAARAVGSWKYQYFFI